MVLALISGLTVDYRVTTQWLNHTIGSIMKTIASYTGFSPPLHLIEVCYVFAILSWFQPVALRLGLLRCSLWVIACAALGIAAAFVFENPSGENYLLDLILVSHLCGVPGLVTIGARTRPWLTFVGAAAALAIVAGLWQFKSVDSLSFVTGILLANLPYAAVMIYGTRPVHAAT